MLIYSSSTFPLVELNDKMVVMNDKMIIGDPVKIDKRKCVMSDPDCVFTAFYLCVTGYSAVAFDGAGNYGHTPTHHSSQFSNHSFKHEDALAQQSTMGKRVF